MKKKWSWCLTAFLIMVSLCACKSYAKNSSHTTANQLIINSDTVNFVDLNTLVYQENGETLTDDGIKIVEKYDDKEYYIYGNGDFIGKYKGNIYSGEYDGNWHIAFDKFDYKVFDFDTDIYIASTDELNAYPRECKTDDISEQTKAKIESEINSICDVNAEIFKTVAIDLDSCGEYEYVVFAKDTARQYTYICLTDSNYKIVSFLIAYEDGEDLPDYFSDENILKLIEIIDIDNDGIMEIVTKVPTYEGWHYSVYKYCGYYFYGDFFNRVSLLP